MNHTKVDIASMSAVFEGPSDNCRFIVVIFVFLYHDAYPVFVGTITIYIIFLLHVAGDYDDTCQT